MGTKPREVSALSPRFAAVACGANIIQDDPNHLTLTSLNPKLTALSPKALVFQ